MAGVVANAWRGECIITCGNAVIKLRCRMNTLGTILQELECDTLIEVFRKWDGLAPQVFEKTLFLLAENPTDAEKFWASVDGLRGLEAMRVKFYEISSGQTPDEIKSEDENRKKLAAFLAQKSAEEVATIVTALNLQTPISR